MKVKNAKGTADKTCKCGTWLKHWESTSGEKVPLCPVVGCLEKVHVGAHVYKSDSTDGNSYIVPLCTKHNNGSHTMDIGSTTLVSASKAKTCDS